MDKSLRKMSIGVIVRDSSGEVLAILSAPKMYIIDPVNVEASVTLRAAVFCKELGLQMVELEGAALQIIQALHKDGMNWSIYGTLIDDTRSELSYLQK